VGDESEDDQTENTQVSVVGDKDDHEDDHEDDDDQDDHEDDHEE
jgi:hypothetical protein